MDGAGAMASWMEQMTHVRRLSPKTVEAYRHDVGGFLGFLQQHRGEAVDLDALKDVSASDVRGWLATRREDGLGPRGVARAVSALRTFFMFLQKQGLVENLNVRRVRPPKLPPGVPKPVSIAGAQSLLDEAEIFGAEPWVAARNVAVLTLLYGAGLRISEALQLNREALPLPEALVITGKGNKQRVVPILAEARIAIDDYIKICPYGAVRDDPVFYGARGKRLNPRIVQGLMQYLRRALGFAGECDAACVASCVRDASVGGGRRLTCDTGIAGACVAVDDAALYRRRRDAFDERVRARASAGAGR